MTVEVKPRRYPVARPALGEIDRRMTFGLLIDVGKVLAEHGYPVLDSGADVAELQQALFTFLYGRLGPAEAAAAVAEFEASAARTTEPLLRE